MVVDELMMTMGLALMRASMGHSSGGDRIAQQLATHMKRTGQAKMEVMVVLVVLGFAVAAAVMAVAVLVLTVAAAGVVLVHCAGTRSKAPGIAALLVQTRLCAAGLAAGNTVLAPPASGASAVTMAAAVTAKAPPLVMMSEGGIAAWCRAPGELATQARQRMLAGMIQLQVGMVAAADTVHMPAMSGLMACGTALLRPQLGWGLTDSSSCDHIYQK